MSSCILGSLRHSVLCPHPYPLPSVSSLLYTSSLVFCPLSCSLNPRVRSSVLCPQLQIPQLCPHSPTTRASAPLPQALGSLSPSPVLISIAQSLDPESLPRSHPCPPGPRITAPLALRVEGKEVEPRAAGTAPLAPRPLPPPPPRPAAAHLRRAPRTRRWLPPLRP